MNKFDTFSQRFWAALIDSLIFFVISVSVSISLDIFSHNNELFDIIINILSLIYSIYFHGKFGATLGKQFMNVKIVNYPDETAINFKQAFIRDSPIVISVIIDIIIYGVSFFSPSIAQNSFVIFIYDASGYLLTIWFLLEIITMLFNKKNRALHDFIAKTIVIKTK